MVSDAWYPFPRYLLRKNLVKTILGKEQLTGKKCLELGYGAGDMLLLFAERGLEVYGFDFSSVAYLSASERIKENNATGGKITLLKNEEEIIKRTYDYIMAFEVLEHIEDDAGTLRKWRALLKPCGKIIISFPAHMKRWNDSDVAVGHYRRYDRRSFSDLLEKTAMHREFLWNYGFPLTIALDPLLNRLYQDKAVNHGVEKKEELSKDSGVKRKKSIVIRALSNDVFLSPFYFLQRLFLEKELGSAYIGVLRPK